MGFACLQGADARLEDWLRGRKVRLADAQGDHILHGGDDIEKLANAGWLQTHNTPGKVLGSHICAHIGSFLVIYYPHLIRCAPSPPGRWLKARAIQPA